MEHVSGITTFFSDLFTAKSDLKPLTKEEIAKNVGEALALHQAGKGTKALAILNDLVKRYNDPAAKKELDIIQENINYKLREARGYKTENESKAFNIFFALSDIYNHPEVRCLNI